MKSKGLLVATLLLGSWIPGFAQDTPDTAGADPDTGKSSSFWEDTFALYLETSFGTASSNEINTSVETTDVLGSMNEFTIDEQENARIAVGWELGEGKGRFRIIWEGLKEDSYEFDASGRRISLIGSGGDPAPEPLEWWNLTIRDGMLVSQAQEQLWDPDEDDTNADGVPDLDEIRTQALDLGSSRDVVDTLQNQIQTLDLMYMRDWGGRQINATWGAGLRHFVYEGNLPTAAWLAPSFTASPTEGFTEGSNLRLISLAQESTGLGPTGMAEVHFNFLRDRITLYLLGRASFLIQDSEVDSGDFFTLVRNNTTGNVFVVQARITETRDKDVWHTGAEVGGRIRIADGLHVHLAYYFSAYADAVLALSKLTIPETLEQAPFGVSGQYRTRDFRLDGIRAGFSFQF